MSMAYILFSCFFIYIRCRFVVIIMIMNFIVIIFIYSYSCIYIFVWWRACVVRVKGHNTHTAISRCDFSRIARTQTLRITTIIKTYIYIYCRFFFLHIFMHTKLSVWLLWFFFHNFSIIRVDVVSILFYRCAYTCVYTLWLYEYYYDDEYDAASLLHCENETNQTFHRRCGGWPVLFVSLLKSSYCACGYCPLSPMSVVRRQWQWFQ